MLQTSSGAFRAARRRKSTKPAPSLASVKFRSSAPLCFDSVRGRPRRYRSPPPSEALDAWLAALLRTFPGAAFVGPTVTVSVFAFPARVGKENFVARWFSRAQIDGAHFADLSAGTGKDVVE